MTTTTQTKISRDLAMRFLDDWADELNVALMDGGDCVDSLALELDAAIADRWIEWQDARKAGWPLGRPLVER